MNVKQFEIPGLSQYAYVISSEGEAIVIDPIRDYNLYLQYAEEQGLTIRYVTETHIHADFASGAAALATATGAELVLSGHDEGELYRYAMPHRTLRDGEELSLGKIKVKAIHTPGHTPEHFSFLLLGEGTGTFEPTALFSGDFLFAGSLGRPDLLGDGETQRLARELYRSVHERIAMLPDEVRVCPGHGAGSLCGSGMSDQPESTLGEERRTQHLFRLDENEFVREILASSPPLPTYYPRMKALNSFGAVDVHEVATPKPLSPGQFNLRMKNGHVTLLDLRRPEAFGGAHIPNAINIGAGQNLSLWAGWLLDPETQILLIGDSGTIEEARLSLLRVGLDGVEGYLAKGFSTWIESGLPIARTTQLSTQEMHDRASSVEVVDVRSDQEWKAGHIAGAKHIMLGDLTKRLQELQSSLPLYVACGSGYRSNIAASLLQQAGFTDVSSMAGGMMAWNAQHLPLGDA